MKRNLFLLLALLTFSLQSFAQVSGSNFEAYFLKYRFGPQPLDYFEQKNFVETNMLALNSIAQDGDVNKVDATKVRSTLANLFRYSSSTGKLLLDWEKAPFKNLRDYPVTDSRYKEAEAEWKKLISIVRNYRPNVKIGIYGIPFRSWGASTIQKFNPPGKYDNLLSLVDFLAPSVYLQHPNEEVGRERNVQYIKDNMNPALDYGKRLNKPVYPFFWHKIHPVSCDEYGSELMQLDVFAYYIKLLSTYSYNNYRAKGFYWWEAYNDRKNLDNVDGVNNWARGMISSTSDYDAMMVKYASAVVKALSGSTSEPEASPSTGTQQVSSFTLYDARTGSEIQKISNGATLNLSSLPTTYLNIRANTNTSSVGSVKFNMSGEQSRSVTESHAPFDLAGDNGGWTPSTGSYTLKATPYSESGATGTAGTALTVNFSVVNGTSSSGTSSEGSFTLINADTDKDIQTLNSGATINLAALPTKNLNIRFNASSVGSVVFYLSGTQSRKRTESGAPYALIGDNNSDYYGWTPSLGSYTLKATPYTSSGGSGTALSSKTINFTVVNNSNSTIGVTLASNATAAGGALATKEELAGEQLSVYPVPATTTLYVDLGSEAAEGETTIELSDLNGRVVLSKKLNTATDGRNAEFNLEGLSKGLYILTASSSAGRATKKVLVN